MTIYETLEELCAKEIHCISDSGAELGININLNPNELFDVSGTHCVISGYVFKYLVKQQQY